MMAALVERLEKGNYSCVIANGNDIRTFNRKGVVDIYDLLKKEPEFLSGALIADKVIGKAAAALLVLGKIREVYAGVISLRAVELFESYGIKVSYGQSVPYIINRTHTGWCPLEKLSRNLKDPYEIFEKVESFVNTQKQQSEGNVMRWYIFHNDMLLLEKDDKGLLSVPCGETLPCVADAGCRVHTVYLNGGKEVRACSVDCPVNETDKWIMVGLRKSYDFIPYEDYRAAGKAYQILYWDRHSCFCPVCGSPMKYQTPIMKKCPQCGNEMYPPVATAIIVLVRKDDEVLLVHARNFRGTFYGLVAGFLEAGETLEECVAREVFEETGLKIKNITYFSSQPWPYPSGLMVGFVADYESGEIKLQDDELSAGAFYSRENMPELPQKLSIARKLIDWWLANP